MTYLIILTASFTDRLTHNWKGYILLRAERFEISGQAQSSVSRHRKESFARSRSLTNSLLSNFSIRRGGCSTIRTLSSLWCKNGEVCRGWDAKRIVFAQRCVASLSIAFWIPSSVSGKHQPVSSFGVTAGLGVTTLILHRLRSTKAISAPESW
jgi:hypothetical protein